MHDGLSDSAEIATPRYRPHSRPIEVGYSNWCAVAGFFDGDGSLDVDPRAYTIHWAISFSDNWYRQIEQVRRFLRLRRIRVGTPRRIGVGAWVCEVKEISSLKLIAEKMLRSGGTFKKRAELELLLDYYRSEVTGTDVIEFLNTEVKEGIRVGKIRHIGMPFTYSEGLVHARSASNHHQYKLTEHKRNSLVKEYLAGAVTGKALAAKFNVSEATVSRLLKREGIARRVIARRAALPAASPTAVSCFN